MYDPIFHPHHTLPVVMCYPQVLTYLRIRMCVRACVLAYGMQSRYLSTVSPG